jgi:Uma2 family endonuclease
MAKTATAQPETRLAECPTPMMAEREPDYAEQLEAIEKIARLNLPEEDGIPLESEMHYTLPWMLRLSIQAHWEGRTDFYIGCNMFLYYAYEQAEEIVQAVRRQRSRRVRFKGPDLFLVRGVEDTTRPRPYWAVWLEQGRYPDLIVEFLSPSTAQNDKTHKKELYAKVFHTPEYFWYDPFTQEFAGFRLAMFPNWHYEPIAPNEQGWLWSEVLSAYLGTWTGKVYGREQTWLRLYDAEGNLVLLGEEREATARAQAEQARQRAEAAERRVAELEAELKRLRGG